MPPSRTSPQDATLHRLRPKVSKLRAERAGHLRQLVLSLDLPAEPENRILREIDRATAPDRQWEFVMVNTDAHHAVVNYLFENAKRPKTSVKLWSLLFTVTNHQTGRVIATQAEMAEALGVPRQDVSSAMSELVKINAVLKTRHGRSVTYVLNPNVGTSLGGQQRALAQQDAGPLRLVVS